MSDLVCTSRTTLSTEFIKDIAEGSSIENLPDDAAKDLAEDVSYRLKHVIGNASKFMRHGKRQVLTARDIDCALKVKNITPTYGFVAKNHIPFGYASGGGSELHFTEEDEIDLFETVAMAGDINWPKLPLQPDFQLHWLSVGGIQPTIPENPPPISREVQKLESTDPVSNRNSNDNLGKPSIKSRKLCNVESVQVKQLATHEVNVEQQRFYKEITEACVGTDEHQRSEAFASLSTDSGLYEILARLCTFIVEGVRINIVQYNLAVLIYLMRMVKALLDNPNLNLEKYLHELIPSVITCIVSKQLSVRPEDNHWALRAYASRLMAQICKNYNNTTNNIQTRVTRVLSQVLVKKNEAPLTTLYGAIEGLYVLGPDVVKVLFAPKIESISHFIQTYLEESNSTTEEKIAAERIKTLLNKCNEVLHNEMEQSIIDVK